MFVNNLVFYCTSFLRNKCSPAVLVTWLLNVSSSAVLLKKWEILNGQKASPLNHVYLGTSSLQDIVLFFTGLACCQSSLLQVKPVKAWPWRLAPLVLFVRLPHALPRQRRARLLQLRPDGDVRESQAAAESEHPLRHVIAGAVVLDQVLQKFQESDVRDAARFAIIQSMQRLGERGRK